MRRSRKVITLAGGVSLGLLLTATSLLARTPSPVATKAPAGLQGSQAKTMSAKVKPVEARLSLVEDYAQSTVAKVETTSATPTTSRSTAIARAARLRGVSRDKASSAVFVAITKPGITNRLVWLVTLKEVTVMLHGGPARTGRWVGKRSNRRLAEMVVVIDDESGKVIETFARGILPTR